MPATNVQRPDIFSHLPRQALAASVPTSHRCVLTIWRFTSSFPLTTGRFRAASGRRRGHRVDPLLVIACSSLSFKPMGLLSYACIFLGSMLTALNASPAVCTLGFLQVAGLVVCLFAGQTDPCPVVIALTLGMGRGGRVHGLLAQAQGTGGIGAQTLKTLTCGCASESLPKAWQLHHPSW